MKVVLLITALVCWLYTPAQDTRLHSPLALGKGRLVVLFTVASDNWNHPHEPDLFESRTPVFINKKQLCRMQYLTYTIHDVDTGNYEIATQFSGRKIDKTASTTHATITAEKVTYMEIFRDIDKGWLRYQIMPVPENLALDIMGKLLPVKNCKVE
jgi:hypothetical protein